MQVIMQMKRTSDGKIINISVDGPYGKVEETKEAIKNNVNWTGWEQQ